MNYKNPFPVSPDREKDKKYENKLLYGYVTHYKGTEKVRISQHGLLRYNEKHSLITMQS